MNESRCCSGWYGLSTGNYYVDQTRCTSCGSLHKPLLLSMAMQTATCSVNLGAIIADEACWVGQRPGMSYTSLQTLCTQLLPSQIWVYMHQANQSYQPAWVDAE